MIGQTIIFLIPSEHAIECVNSVKAIARITLKEATDAPEKFKLAMACADKMLSLQPVTCSEFIGFCDSIGGYYSATSAYFAKYCKTEEDQRRTKIDLDWAGKLMGFAMILEDQAREVWPDEMKKWEQESREGSADAQQET